MIKVIWAGKEYYANSFQVNFNKTTDLYSDEEGKDYLFTVGSEGVQEVKTAA